MWFFQMLMLGAFFQICYGICYVIVLSTWHRKSLAGSQCLPAQVQCFRISQTKLICGLQDSGSVYDQHVLNWQRFATIKHPDKGLRSLVYFISGKETAPVCNVSLQHGPMSQDTMMQMFVSSFCLGGGALQKRKSWIVQYACCGFFRAWVLLLTKTIQWKIWLWTMFYDKVYKIYFSICNIIVFHVYGVDVMRNQM